MIKLFFPMLGAALLSATALGSDPLPSGEPMLAAYPTAQGCSSCAKRNFPADVYWGDIHVHMGMSMDADA